MRDNLNALPTGVYDIYKEEMIRILEQPEEDSTLAQRAFSYIFCAKRPLHVGELRHALAVEAEDTDIDEEAFVDSETLLNASFGLIRIDDVSNTIGLVHYTLQEYLENHPEYLLPNPETVIATTCLTYLSFEVFDSGPCSDGEALNQRLRDYQFLDYASRHWGHHIARGEFQMDLLFTYLEDDQKLSCFVQVLHLNPNWTDDRRDQFPKRFSSLHVSSYWGLVKIVRILLDKGLDVNIRDSYGATPLQVAARDGHEPVVKLLLDNKADIITENNRGETALYWAARNGHKTVVRLLLERGAVVSTRDNEGWNALDWAVLEGNSEIVKQLLEQGVDAENDGRNNALYLAAWEGHDDTVQMLLDNGADVNSKDWLGSTALDWAAPVGHETTVRVLLRNGANVDSCDEYQNTALHWAIPYEPIVKLLLENSANVDFKNNTGQTALCWAARDGSAAVVKLLAQRTADLNIYDDGGCTALHGSALRGREDVLRVLLNQGANPNAKDNDGWTPLHAAALKRHKEIMQILLPITDDGRAILDWVVTQQQDPKRHLLLMDIADKKIKGCTVVMGIRAAVQERHLSKVQILLEQGADINGTDIVGSTALIGAAELGYLEGVKQLLRNGANVNLAVSRGWTALHWAARSGQEVVLPLLIEYGGDVNASGNSWTPILLAAENGHERVTRFFADNKADVHAEDYHGRTALHWSAMHGHTSMLRLLVLEKGANIDAVDRWGRTALIWAIENKQHSATLTLLSIGADLNVKTRDGSNALHLAIFMRQAKIVQELLDRGASVHVVTRDGFTPLHIAALVGHEAIIRILLDKGADIDLETQWRPFSGAFDHREGVAGKEEVELLTSHLRKELLEQRIIGTNEAETPQTFTTRQLAGNELHEGMQKLTVQGDSRHVSKQRISGNLC